MKYSSIGYLIGEGLRNILKNKKSTFASIIIMFMTMFIFGIFFVLGENINSFMHQIESEQGIRVFINDVADDRVNSLKQEIEKINGVASVTFVTKAEALEELKNTIYKNNPELMEDFPEEMLPMGYVVKVSDITLDSQVREQILKLQDVDELGEGEDTIKGLITAGNGIRIITAVFLVILIIISVFIISNTIKLAVHSRRKEISIMKYVGATNSFIRWPFIVEGILIGIIAAAISILIVGGVYQFAITKFAGNLAEYELQAVAFKSMFNIIVLTYAGLGIGIGTIGSSLSMKKYLEV